MRLNERSLDNVIGGSTTLSGTVLTAITNIIKILLDAGNGVGSAIRRAVDNDICPLK